MQGLLLGLGDIIGNAFKAVLMAVVKPILELVIKWVVEPILTLLIKVIMYTIGAVLYVIGSFLLQLVDFVEVLFRALAGMESVSASGMSMSLSLDGGSGDILIQLIRHPDIQSAFVSMCVVGLFLLVVTTVFQIIKVEYTTEGAKNAKGPIFQKAFKGFANLMLLPLLVIFGIIFANQLLGLLDTATKGTGDNPTISGLIFVSSAGDAHYLSNEEPMDIEGDSWIGICLDGIGYGIIELLNGLFGGAWEEGDAVNTRLNEGKIDEIENNFISQKAGYRYYNIGEVSQYYNYAYINYLLLLFGAVFALKALFFSCFGMVIRLYKCAVLFIISPAIIGMTPINEGGLGKWRQAFIGQVLSAYGTILSLNLFFIIVRVLLSVEVNFVSSADNVIGNMLTDGFMTLLLKAIFVLAGCLLIEKFSKEIGAYFGADDAMSAGKDMAGQVGDLAMKGVGAAAMVASGGAGLAMKAGKMAGGIAGKIKGGVKNSIATGTGKLSEKQFVEDQKKKHNFADMSQEDQAKFMEKVGEDWNKEKGNRETAKARLTKGHYEEASATRDGLIDKRKGAQEKVDKAQGIIDAKKARMQQLEDIMTDPNRKISEAGMQKLMSEHDHLSGQVAMGERSLAAAKNVVAGIDKGENNEKTKQSFGGFMRRFLLLDCILVLVLGRLEWYYV